MKPFLLLAAIAAAVALPQAAHAGPPAPAVPTAIQPPAGHRVFLVGHAAGVQIYRCGASGWALVAPRANLYGDNGKLITTHFGGPAWQARDGSRVMAARVEGVTVDPTAIPWLLLAATSAAAGPDGDRLAATTYIQRIATTGGLAPAAADCNAATAGDVVEIPYTADYVFWKAQSQWSGASPTGS